MYPPNGKFRALFLIKLHIALISFLSLGGGTFGGGCIVTANFFDKLPYELRSVSDWPRTP